MNSTALALGLCLIASAATAQTTAPTNPPGAGGSGTVSPTPSRDTGIKDSSAGVIHPGHPDPGMSVQPPAAGITPVVPPTGTGGNAPAVIPK